MRTPNWKDIKDVTMDISRGLNFVSYIGRDLSLTPDDKIQVIEANGNTEVRLLQIHKPLLTDKWAKQFYIDNSVVKA